MVNINYEFKDPCPGMLKLFLWKIEMRADYSVCFIDNKDLDKPLIEFENIIMISRTIEDAITALEKDLLKESFKYKHVINYVKEYPPTSTSPVIENKTGYYWSDNLTGKDIKTLIGEKVGDLNVTNLS